LMTKRLVENPRLLLVFSQSPSGGSSVFCLCRRHHAIITESQVPKLE
jgi:hypothetical protein